MSTLLLNLSESFHDAIRQAAEEQDTTVSNLIRQAIAKHIGYDLTQDKKPSRSKYPSKQARTESERLRSSNNRVANRIILDVLRKQLKAEEIAYIEEWLNMHPNAQLAHPSKSEPEA